MDHSVEGHCFFLVFNVLFYSYNITLRTLFIAYSVILGAITLTTFFLWPWVKFPQSKPIIDVTKQYTGIGHNRDVTIQEEDGSKTNLNQEEPTYWEQLKVNAINLHFFYLSLFIPLMVVCGNFYLATSNQQLDLLTDDAALKSTYSVVLAYMLPIIGIVSAPAGLVLDRFGVNAGIFFFVTLCCIAHGIGIIRNMPLQIVRFVLFSIYYPYTYTLWADIICKKFGFATYGVLFGVVAAVSGVFGFATTALVNFAIKTNQFDWINIGWIFGTLMGLIYPVIMLVYSCVHYKDNGERDVLMRKST